MITKNYNSTKSKLANPKREVVMFELFLGQICRKKNDINLSKSLQGHFRENLKQASL